MARRSATNGQRVSARLIKLRADECTQSDLNDLHESPPRTALPLNDLNVPTAEDASPAKLDASSECTLSAIKVANEKDICVSNDTTIKLVPNALPVLNTELVHSAGGHEASADEYECIHRSKRTSARFSVSATPESPQPSVSKHRLCKKVIVSDEDFEPEPSNSTSLKNRVSDKRKRLKYTTPVKPSTHYTTDDPWSFDVDGFDVHSVLPNATPKPAHTESEAHALLRRAYTTSVKDQPIVHPKKVAEISAWLERVGRPADALPGRVLVLKGPAGCGKSATLRTLCATRGIDIVDSLGSEDTAAFKHTHAAHASREARYTALSMVTEMDDFDVFPSDFLDRACASRRVAVYDSLPHPAAADAIAALCSRAPSDTILLVTSPCGDADRGEDACESAIARLCKAPFATTISLNALAPTFMRRLGLEDSSDGDACAALVLKAMTCIYSSALDVSCMRDAPVNIFHALGRVLYVRGTKERVDVDALASSDRPSFHDALHANYPRFLSPSALEQLVAIANALSEAGAVPWPTAIHPGLDSYMALPERTAAHAVAASAALGAVPYRFAPMEGPRRFRPQRRTLSFDHPNLHVAYNWTS